MVARKTLMKKFGISRKVLEHYNKLGLLCPSNIDEIETGKQVGLKKPEWKYDDDAYDTLQFIEVLRFVDYEPADIKILFEKSDSILDDVMTKLIKKKKDLEKMIIFVKLMQMGSKIPESADPLFENYKRKYLYNGQKFRDNLEDLIGALPEGVDDSDLEENETYSIISNLLFSIIEYQEKDPESDEVQGMLWSIYNTYLKILHEGDKCYEYLDHLMLYSEWTNSFVENMENDFIKDNMEELKIFIDDKSIKFVLDALKYFQIKHDGNYFHDTKIKED